MKPRKFTLERSVQCTVYSVTSSLPALGFAAKRNNYFSWTNVLAKFRYNLFREKRRNFREKNCETFRSLKPYPALNLQLYKWGYTLSGQRFKGLKGIVLNPTCLVFKWKITWNYLNSPFNDALYADLLEMFLYKSSNVIYHLKIIFKAKQ